MNAFTLKMRTGNRWNVSPLGCEMLRLKCVQQLGFLGTTCLTCGGIVEIIISH